jgi:hypothetical protein
MNDVDSGLDFISQACFCEGLLFLLSAADTSITERAVSIGALSVWPSPVTKKWQIPISL